MEPCTGNKSDAISVRCCFRPMVREVLSDKVMLEERHAESEGRSSADIRGRANQGEGTPSEKALKWEQAQHV